MASITPSKPVADVKKHVFDNSQQHVFSAKVGQLLPVFNLETMPNGDYEINVADLLRTMQLNEAAYIRCKQNIDFFFVPYSQLYTRFNQFFAQREDPVIYGSELPSYLPNIDLIQLVLSVATTPFNDSSFADMFDYSLRCQVGKILDLLGYGCYPLEKPLTTKVTSGGVDYYKLSDDWYGFIKSFYSSESAMALSLFEVNPIIHLKDDWFDILQEHIDDNDIHYYVNPFRAAAYNKIWNDFYRNPYRDTPLDPFYFNFDDIKGTTVENSHVSNGIREWTQICDMFNMRYRRWKNDIFTASYPDAQFGNASAITMQTITPISGMSFDSFAMTNPLFNFIETGHTVSNVSLQLSYEGDIVAGSEANDLATNNNIHSSAVSVHSNGSLRSNLFGFTIAQLRQAIAMQHWAENVIRAGNRTSDNFRAHFGVTPRYESEMHVKFLGSFDGRIDLNIVSATSDSTTVSNLDKRLGSLASNGISSLKGQTINFHANDFGIIVGVFSLLPEAEYNSSMCDKANIKLEPFDFPTPEFQNIGFTPITSGELRFDALANNEPVGYVFPYFEYKTALDKVHGEFQKRVNYIVNRYGEDPAESFIEGSKSYYVAPRWQMQYDLLKDVRVLYVNPRVYDTVFGVAADDSQKTDQFNITAYFDVKSRLPLSVLGLPQY